MSISIHYPRLVKAVAAIASVLAMMGCSTSILDPQNVGNGQFLQILQGELVLIETDTSNAGMLNCPNQAYQLMQKNSALVGRVKCSKLQSQDPLPYSFRAHILLGIGEQYKNSSPYLTRTKTAQACESMRLATSKAEKTIILEDNCKIGNSLPIKQTSTQTPTPQPPASSNLTGDRLRQLEQLRRDRLITEDEFKVRREAILNQL